MSRPANPAVEAVSAAIAQDDELAGAARTLAATAIATAHYYLVHGAPAQQLKVVTALLPAIGKALAGAGEDEEMAEMRAQLRGLQAAMLEETG